MTCNSTERTKMVSVASRVNAEFQIFLIVSTER